MQTSTVSFNQPLRATDTIHIAFGKHKFQLHFPVKVRRIYKRGFCVIVKQYSSSLTLRKLIVRNANSKKLRISHVIDQEDDWPKDE